MEKNIKKRRKIKIVMKMIRLISKLTKMKKGVEH